jgi:hypothetical protein
MSAAHHLHHGPADEGDSEGGEIDAKRDSTLIARAALAGIVLVRLADRSWLASRWGLFRPLTDADVGTWLDTVGAPR